MTFQGWPPEALEFYEGLEADNSKAYWTAQRDIYEQSVRAPMEALAAACADLGPFKLFRYRDVRFSRDKTPYKTAIGAVTEREGGAVLYVQLSADGLFAAAGYHHMASDQVERYREAVASEAGAELQPVLAALEQGGYDVGGEELKVTPRGYPRDHPRARLLRHKGLTMGKLFPPARWLHTKAALDRVRKVWADARPLSAWLEHHVGPSALPPEVRR